MLTHYGPLPVVFSILPWPLRPLAQRIPCFAGYLSGTQWYHRRYRDWTKLINPPLPPLVGLPLMHDGSRCFTTRLFSVGPVLRAELLKGPVTAREAQARAEDFQKRLAALLEKTLER